MGLGRGCSGVRVSCSGAVRHHSRTAVVQRCGGGGGVTGEGVAALRLLSLGQHRDTNPHFSTHTMAIPGLPHSNGEDFMGIGGDSG